jgi:16S rRNA (cytosine967-C5)-methyltransferase
MSSRIAANQQRTFLALLAQVLPHVASDSALPRRIKELLSRNRAFGSRDRRLYRELIYTAIRFLPWVRPFLERSPDEAARLVAWLAPEVKDTVAFRAALLAEWPAVPLTLAEKSAILTGRLPVAGLPAPVFPPEGLLPAWFREHCPAAFVSPQLDRLNERASLWVRLQVKDPSHVLSEFAGAGWNPVQSPDLPDAWRLPPNAEVADSDAYRRGFVEIQDLGSQLILHHAPIAPGQRWLDACAGAGGKTLQLARLVGDSGHVDATDIRPAALAELRERAARAKLDNVRITAKPGDTYDGVLVDAPCSGTGTWRRLPHMKWYTQPAMLPAFAADQLAILSAQAPRVRDGGLLVYATCSLSRVENQEVVATFLENHPNFAAERAARDWGAVADGVGHTLLPATLNTDGFYVAVLRRQG